MLRLYIYFGFGWHFDPWSYRFFPVELGTFLLGTISYRIYRKIKDRPESRKVGTYLLAFVVVLIVHWKYVPGFASEIPNVLFVLLLCVATPYIFLFTKTSRFDRWIGELSYPIYIIHIAMLYVVGKLYRMQWIDGSSGTLVGILLTVISSMILIQFIEKPIDRFRHRIAS